MAIFGHFREKMAIFGHLIVNFPEGQVDTSHQRGELELECLVPLC